MSDLKKSDERFVDDPMVHSEKLFKEGCALQNSDEYEKALSVLEQYRKYHPEDPKVYFEIACCHYCLENYDLVLDLVNRAISINFEYGEAYALKAYIFLEKKDYGNAIPILQYCNVVLPNDEVTLFGLLQAYAEVGLIASAMVCAKQLLVLKPLEIQYQVYEAGLYYRQGQYDTAIELLEKVIANNPEEMQHIEMLNEIKGMKMENGNCRYPGMNN